MKIFGIGLNKTGTTTLGACLEKLGYKHLTVNLKLLRRVHGEGRVGDALKVAEHFDSFEDWPWPLIYKELDAHFSDAKFILTKRSSGEKWFNSLVKHYRRLGATYDIERVYGCEKVGEEEREHLIEQYDRHNREVEAYFADRPDRFRVICWEEGDSWEKLCDFIGRVPPDAAFPYANRAPRIIKGRIRNQIAWYLAKCHIYKKHIPGRRDIGHLLPVRDQEATHQ